MITMFVKINTLYSAIIVMVQTTEYCNNTDIATSTAFLLVCIFIGIFSEVVYFLNAWATNKHNSKLYSTLVTFRLISMMTCLPLYLLADYNRQPLDCAFGCDTFTLNMTANAIACNNVVNESVRLGFTSVSLIFIATIPIVYFILNQKAREEFTEIGSAMKYKLEEIDLPDVGAAIKDTVTDMGGAVKDKMDDLAWGDKEKLDDIKPLVT